MKIMSEKIIAIDLGSYNSCVSLYEGSDLKVIANSEGGLTTPSYVAFTDDGIKVGEPAKRQATTNPEKTIFNIKRLMGKSYEQVKNLKRPYQIVNDNGRASVKINDRNYSPEEISSMIIQKMKKTAEDYLGYSVNKAIITVPAHFNSDERESTRIAGEIAGLEVLRVIAEPTAAVLNIDANSEKKYAVLDIGGMTFDFSVVDVADGVFEILATDGDLELGGSVIDERLVNHLADEFLKNEGVDLRKDPMALQRLYDASEKAKIELSGSQTTDINIPYITATETGPKHLVHKLTRSKFEQLINDIVKRAIEISQSALSSSGLKWCDLDDVLLVGGTSRIPAIQDELEKLFGKKPSKVLNPDHCVATGAAIQGGILAGDNKDILLLDCLGISIGIETMGNVMTKMIESNTTIPTSKSQVFSTAQDNQNKVDIVVLQGERTLAKDNKRLGVFTLDIESAKRGEPQIEITYDLDSNGILTVTAEDKSTGKKNNITISGSSKLSDDEIKRMKQEAEENLEADKIALDKINKLNETDSFIFSIEKQLSETNINNKEDIETVLIKLKDAKESQDLDSIDKYMKEVSDLLQKATENVTNDDTSQDIEFEEVN